MTDGVAQLGPFPKVVPGPKLLRQRVPEPKAVKNRMHFDIEIADIHAQRTASSPLAHPGERRTSCIGGAMQQDDYRAAIEAAGLSIDTVDVNLTR